MKKLMIVSLLLSLAGSANAVYYTAPNAGNMDFYPMMQYQMEKQETLDFVNKPEEYKEKRQQEEEERNYEKSLQNKNFKFNSKDKENSFFKYTKPVNSIPQSKMEFVKDENGNVTIKEVK